MRCEKAWRMYERLGALAVKSAEQREYLEVYRAHLRACAVCRDHNEALFDWARHGTEVQDVERSD